MSGIDLEVGAGDVFGLLGPNGAGKSTTLRMLTTLLTPTAGEAEVAGFDLRTEAERVRGRIGYVSQQGGVDLSVSGRRELVFQGRLYGLDRLTASARAEDLLRGFELKACADRAIQSYSGGQRRRLEIALGLVHRPVLLFLDEPTTGLDPQARAHLWDEIQGLRAQGTTVFLTTHYLDEADALCDRVAIVDHGSVVAEGTPGQLKATVAGDVITIGVRGGAAAGAAALRAIRGLGCFRGSEAGEAADRLRVYVDGGETALPAIFEALREHGVGVDSVSVRRPSLDDVFFSQTGRSLQEAA